MDPVRRSLYYIWQYLTSEIQQRIHFQAWLLVKPIYHDPVNLILCLLLGFQLLGQRDNFTYSVIRKNSSVPVWLWSFLTASTEPPCIAKSSCCSRLALMVCTLREWGGVGLSSWDKGLQELEEPKDLSVPYWMRSSAIIEFDISRFVLVFSYWMTFGISAIRSAHNASCDVKRKFKSALGLEVLLGDSYFCM